ncbi:hypothetical protein V865_005687 [Kwoniella europaea PYCC6329]|uniref:Uncharacterized protein n=1 Tax=Kwoniella europaea PYCC6329 TaxID=1423913 RepID=A0AAX4KM74_9TREE
MSSMGTTHALTSDHSFQMLNAGSSFEESLPEEWQQFAESTREYLYDPDLKFSFHCPLRSTPKQRRKVQVYKKFADSIISANGERSFDGNIENVEMGVEKYSEGERSMDETDRVPSRSTEQDHNEQSTTFKSSSTSDKQQIPTSRGLASDRQAENAINSQLTITAVTDSSMNPRHRIFSLLSRAWGLR